MEEFEILRKILQQYLSHAEIKTITRACDLAEKAHAGQKRHTGEDYITHPLSVACILAEMRMDPQTIMAAILHDVIEDTPIEKSDLVKEFGQEVADLVDGVTKLTQIEFENRALAQAENFRKMMMAMAKDIRVILVKIADRLHNMRTIQSLPYEKRRRIARETLEIFAPIANRLGMHAFRIEFEDLGFAALYPMRYRIMKEALSKAIGSRYEIIQLIDHEIRERLKKTGIPIRSLSGREKHLYSIYRKMLEKHLSFSEVMDVYGFRIIVNKLDSCYRVLGVLHNLYKPITQRFKDYIAIPKANGYQSLHTVLFGPYGIPIEIQIRTEEMNRTAEYGISAHWLYKDNKSSPYSETEIRTKEWLKDVLEMHDSSRNSLEFIENMKIDLFPDEVYVFTPKGSIMELPAGATPIDFAYAIHSDIGNTCIAAKLDRKLVPLSTTLTNGQQIEIMTAPNARPNPAWLNFVVTGKARSKIKHYLKKQHREESAALGKRLIEKSLQTFGLTLNDISEEKINHVLMNSNLESIQRLFEEVGLGNRMALLAAKQLAHFKDNLTSRESHKKNISPIAIHGTEGIAVTYAHCCRPIPGDPIIGFIEAGRGLIVHTESCATLDHNRHAPDRLIPLHWEEKVQGDFPVELAIDIFNRRGSLASLASIISESESNIEMINAEEHADQHFSARLTLTTRNRKHLAKILRNIRKNKNVIRVTRIKPYQKRKTFHRNLPR